MHIRNIKLNNLFDNRNSLEFKYLESIIIAICFLIVFPPYCAGQTNTIAKEICTDPNIQTILLFKTGNEMSIPILKFRENEKLTLGFDYLDVKGGNYSYSVINCSYDWLINTLPDNLYIDGFNNIPINDFRLSVATSRLYTHYSIDLPDDELKILSSGNYMLKVYKNSDPDIAIITKRFSISESLVEINAKVNLPDEENQELQIEIDLKNLNLTNPLAETRIVVIKNYDWNNIVKIKSPPQLRDKKLYLDMPYQVSSPGGNEFRYFETKDTRYESDKVGFIEFQNPYYHFHLKPDKLKEFTTYFNSQDFNGHFYIEVPKAFNRHEEADYVYVHFTLESAQPFGSDVYIYGALTGYQTDESNYMTYDPQKGIYEKTLLLKQGVYNYAYATKDFDKNNIDFSQTEGNHSETENDYIIFVYLRKPSSEIDRLIGYKIINSSMR